MRKLSEYRALQTKADYRTAYEQEREHNRSLMARNKALYCALGDLLDAVVEFVECGPREGLDLREEAEKARRVAEEKY